jgi:hypothetical protein
MNGPGNKPKKLGENMKLRIPTMIFVPENYEDLKAFKNTIGEGDTISINVSFYQLNVHDQSVIIEDVVLGCDVQSILDAKRVELLKISKEIEALELEIQK